MKILWIYNTRLHIYDMQQADFQSTKSMEKKASKSSGSSTSGGNSGWSDPGDITE